ncbi:hypothetical protein ACFLSA_01785 [Bacteroidota bacterium]
MTTKKRIIISYDKLPSEVIEAINIKYPDGFENHVIKVNKSANEYFYAITIDTNETSYLVKVNVNVDASYDEFEPNIASSNGIQDESEDGNSSENEVEEKNDSDDYNYYA